MDIRDCLLEDTNRRPLAGRTLGEVIADSGHRHLWDERPLSLVDTVVIHYISCVEVQPKEPFNLDAVLQIFPMCGVSSHFLVPREDTVLRLVPVECRAWHCGGSIMPEPDNREAVNAFSVGIELVATHESGFTRHQYEAAARLCREIHRLGARATRVLGHEHIAGSRAVSRGLRRDTKADPGPAFSWETLRECIGAGVGSDGTGLVLRGGDPGS